MLRSDAFDSQRVTFVHPGFARRRESTHGQMQQLIEHALGEGATRGAEASVVATRTVVAVRLLLAELAALIGERAAGALYGRGLHLARAALPRPPPGPATHDELLAPLHKELASRPSSEAQRGSRALLSALVDLLVSLIGEPLSHRLLTKAWAPRADAPVARHTHI